jgi:N-carbamoyl-L-amino-acid hydrolase
VAPIDIDTDININAGRLLARIRALGQIGRGADGALSRLAGSDADKAGRDALVSWMTSAGLTVQVDAIGNIFGCWDPQPRDTAEAAPAARTPDRASAAPDATDDAGGRAPIVIGSHIDTVIDAGIYDGAYGVLAALEAVESLREAGSSPARSLSASPLPARPLSARPLIVVAFTNEEGVRYTPDMMGSLVHAGGLPVAEALAAKDADGVTLGESLARIGYAGSLPAGLLPTGAVPPRAYLELHIEQGPILEHEGRQIGAVENLQGISWQRITIEGEANHAGTTPMAMRRDAGVAAARVIAFLRDYAAASHGMTVATVGKLRFEPDAINIIPAQATLTADLRDRDNTRLLVAEAALADFLATLAAESGVGISTERLVRFDPVTFDATLVATIEDAARGFGLRTRRMTSGAGHDAQMMARICPAAMIFVPSTKGISHSPREHTSDADLIAGARVLLAVVDRLSRE